MIIITFSGGLGNQMFQYALFKKFQSLGREVKADISFYHEYRAHNGFELEKVFGIKIPVATKEEIEKFKDNYNFLKRYRKFFRLLWKNTDITQRGSDFNEKVLLLKDAYLTGYWQTEKYFEDIAEQIREDFTFKNIDLKNKKIIRKVSKVNSVSLHVRRGDYESDPSTKKIVGGICTTDYYNKAIELIREKAENPVFFIFSDDLKWAKDNLKISSEVYYINLNKDKDNYKDIILMSCCKHNITANSSFSWWGAWLNKNPNKIVICPKKWSNNPKLDSKDRVPVSWIRV